MEWPILSGSSIFLSGAQLSLLMVVNDEAKFLVFTTDNRLEDFLSSLSSIASLK